MKKLLTPLLILSLLVLLQGCANNRTINEGDLLYSVMSSKTFSNGSYKGELKDGFPHGNGTLTYSDGNKYVGEFRYNTLNGKGTLTYSNGNKYVGEFKDSALNGKGTMTYTDGREYVGEFKNGKENGQGTMTYDREYVGEFNPVLVSYKHAGEWKNAKADGTGTLTYASGVKYVGDFVGGFYRGSFHGKGTLTYPNGDKYSGSFDMGWNEQITIYNGFAKGVYNYADGRKYEGEIRHKSPHGKGTMTFPDGKIQSGVWDDGNYLYDLAEQQEREKQKKEAQLAAQIAAQKQRIASQKQRILSKLKPYMDDCQNIGFKVDSKKYRECIVESI